MRCWPIFKQAPSSQSLPSVSCGIRELHLSIFYGFVTKSRILSVALVILDGLFSGRLFGVLLARSVIKCVKFTDVSQKCTFLSHFPWCFGRKIVHVLGWLSGPDWMALAGWPWLSVPDWLAPAGSG